MEDPFIAYRAPKATTSYAKTESNGMPDSIRRAIGRPSSIKSEEMAIEQKISSIGFAGGGAIAAIIVGVIAIALSGAALHESMDHKEGDHNFSKLIVGLNNQGGTSDYFLIGGGEENTVASNLTFIGGGKSNTISDAECSGMIGGEENQISGGTNKTHMVILGGKSNTAEADKSSILGGDTNHIHSTNGDNSAILGGRNNDIKSINSGILAGDHNSIDGSGEENIILGGSYNRIESGSDRSAIIAGGNSSSSLGCSLKGNKSVIVGGEANNIRSDHTIVLGGKGLQTSNDHRWQYATLCGTSNPPNFYPWDNIQPTPSTSFSPGSCYRFAVGIGDPRGINNDAHDIGFAVDNFGNLYFGGGHGSGTIEKGTCIYAMNHNTNSYYAKAFTIQHPVHEEKWLVHGCLEGPESGVYYRGKDIAPTTVKLPEYVSKIASDFTVQVTPIGQPRLMGATEVNEHGFFEVYGDGKFHWHVTGKRLEMDVEPEKEKIVVNRWGPYTWNERI